MSDPNADRITITGHIHPADKVECDFRYLPFDVPPGVTALHVTYDFSRPNLRVARAESENILDLGIFGPDDGSRGEAPTTFRGWSGGARTEFHLSGTTATPGYLPGPIQSGRWHIVLGLYRIASTGCDYTVVVELTRGATCPAEEGAAAGVRAIPGQDTTADDAADEPAWYPGDLQSHTLHSDARATVAQIARVAAHRGLEFLAITDHNTTSHLTELARHSTDRILLLPGMEITTYYGHANVWGIRRWIDFRCRTAADISDRFRDAHAQSALVSINHPYTDCPWTFGPVGEADAIEVWQGLWNEANLAAVAWWDTLLAGGRRIAGVGGSDRHEPAHYDPYFPHQVGTPTTRVRSRSRTIGGILKGIREGRIVVSASSDGPWIDLSVVAGGGEVAEIGDTLRADPGEGVTARCTVWDAPAGLTVQIVADGQVVGHGPVGTGTNTITIDAPVQSPGYVRAQLVRECGNTTDDGRAYPLFLSLTNPVFFRPDAPGAGTAVDG